MADTEKFKRENARWQILLALQAAVPIGLSERLVLNVVQSEFPDTSPTYIREQLNYLETRGLIKITKSPEGEWRGNINRYGTDFVEYTIDAAPGIARPPKYWA
jgi:Fe2+ or Zn2+ uptake regulation protein